MAGQSRSIRTSRDYRRSEINLVSARSAMSNDAGLYSRNVRQGSYTKQRSKRTRRRRILTGILVAFIALLLAGSTAAFGVVTYLNNLLSRDPSGQQINMAVINDLLVSRTAPEDPFWMLLVGTDFDEDGSGFFRSDSIILAYIDPTNKEAALVSIPRDTRVYLDGYGWNKINAAYAWGSSDPDWGYSGPAMLIQAVIDLTGVELAGFAQVDFGGLVAMIDALGGVTVEVLYDIIGDTYAGSVNVYAGEQVLDGEHALVFARSRDYFIGDYQRQANQRTLLQAIAKQILSEDPATIINTVVKIAQMTVTSLRIDELASIASSMRGLQESNIHTYSLRSYTAEIDELSYVIVDEYAARDLIASITAGNFPDYSDEALQGETAARYKPRDTVPDHLANVFSTVETNLYTVSVRNGWGIPGAATAISDMLALAGYKQLTPGNANAMVYERTLIIYRDETDRAAAEDIRARIGYGRVIPSYNRYSFEGNILVMVGGDFAG